MKTPKDFYVVMDNDLISRSALSEEISSLTMTINGLRSGKGVLREFMMEYRKSVLRIVDEAPTIGPESLRPKGRWERVHGDIHSSGYAVRCTECGKYHFVHYRGSLGGLYGHDELFREPPDCPNCGARMEG